jgi:poly(hydroxyalkanoate) granule-associated protein
MRKQIKSSKPVTAVAVNESSRKLLLASLGAVSLVQKQGQKTIDTLVAEGEGFQVRARKAVKTANADARKAVTSVQKQVQKQIQGVVNPIKQRALKNVRKAEAVVTERVGSVLGRFGVPSKGDVQELLARVAELSKEIKSNARRTSARA